MLLMNKTWRTACLDEVGLCRTPWIQFFYNTKGDTFKAKKCFSGFFFPIFFLNCLMKEFRQISFFPTIPAWLLNPDQTSRRKSFEQAAERRRADCYSEKFVFVPSMVVWLSGRADEPNRTTSPPGSNKSLRRRREAPVYLLQLLGALLSSADLTGNKCWGSLFFCRDTRERKPSLK